MKKSLLVLGMFLFLTAWAGRTPAQEASRSINLNSIRSQGASPQDFVPKGWVIETQIEGDLNKDSKPDIVLGLIEDLPDRVKDVPQDRSRALLILFRSEGGALQLAAASARLLRCTTCFGMLQTSPIIKVAKGVLIVNHVYGSRDSVDYTLRFRYEPGLKRFLLIGEDIKSTDRLTGLSTVESTNYLTGQKIIESHRFDDKQQRDVLVSQKTQSVPRTVKSIEQINYDDY
jgi:hypothetical protein